MQDQLRARRGQISSGDPRNGLEAINSGGAQSHPTRLHLHLPKKEGMQARRTQAGRKETGTVVT